jgi:hypothetical protein
VTVYAFEIVTSPATELTSTTATLNGSNNSGESLSCYFEYEIYDEEHNLLDGGTTTPQSVSGTFHIHLNLPSGWNQVDFRAVGEHEEETYSGDWESFNTEASFTTITTLPATEVWATGATIHGMFENTGVSAGYAYAGFQWGLTSPVDEGYVYWLYSGTWGHGKMPIQATISGLLPDRTYYYRACLHVGTPPMVDNIFGATLSFGGPVSIFGHGFEYVTAKKAEDDVSKLAAGRYYMDKSGNFIYESAKHRKE